MTEPMTHAEFAKRASYIAQRAAKWASDSLELPECVSDPIWPGTTERFTTEIAGMLEALVDPKETSLPPLWPIVPWIKAYRALHGVGLKEAKNAHDERCAS